MKDPVYANCGIPLLAAALAGLSLTCAASALRAAEAQPEEIHSWQVELPPQSE